jgi:hypothetical protein
MSSVSTRLAKLEQHIENKGGGCECFERNFNAATQAIYHDDAPRAGKQPENIGGFCSLCLKAIPSATAQFNSNVACAYGGNQ